MAGLDSISALRGLLLVKKEAVYCVDIVPDETDAIKVRNATLTPKFSYLEKPRRGATHISDGKDLATLFYELEFEVDIGGAGDPGVGDLPEPTYGRLLEACSMSSTSTGTPITQWAYAMETLVAITSCTIYWVDLKDETGAHDIYKLLGARGKVSFSGGVDESNILKFTMQAITEDGGPVTGALDLALVDYGDWVEQQDASNGKAMTSTYGGVDLHAKKFEFETNRDLSQKQSIIPTWGIAEIKIGAGAGANHVLKADPPATITADSDQWAAILAQTDAALVLQVDSAQGTRFRFDAPKVQRGEFSRPMTTPSSAWTRSGSARTTARTETTLSPSLSAGLPDPP